MSPAGEELLEQAIRLPPTERAELVGQLLTTFEFPDRGKLDAIWAEEVEDRIRAFKEGKLQSSDAGELFERIDGQTAT